ncbi:FG-GAP repeat protein [Candidatus Cyanaurora vandensis]|nr:FG-GAP repeat protein [Candidatus Cyanaurora vandensis]
MSSAGDVNGDGLADLLVGARDAEPSTVPETGLSLCRLWQD